MKIINKIPKIRMFRILFVGIMVVAFSIGMSYIGSDNSNPAKLVVNTDGYNNANAVENQWGGVRGAASLARAANLSINTILANLGYVLNLLDTLGIVLPDPIVNRQIGNYYYLLYRNTEKEINTKTYTGRLESWRVSAGPTYTKVLEFYWDNIKNPTADDGVLFIIKPYYYDPVHFYEGEMYEVRYKLGPAPDNNKTMVLSFIGATGTDDGFWYNDTALESPPLSASDGCLTRGIVRFTDVSASNWYEFAGVAARECNCVSFEQGGSSYYTLSFLAYKASPNYSTAHFGNNTAAAGDEPNAFTFCTNTPNPLNYGYFSKDGFLSDGNSSDDGVHPNIADVDAITFDSTYDELDATRAALDAKTISFQPGDPI